MAARVFRWTNEETNGGSTVILVLMGGSDSDRDEVLKELMQLYVGRAQQISLSHIPNPVERVARLRMEMPTLHQARYLTIINNPISVEEVTELRTYRALFAHVHGPLASIYKHTPIERKDIRIAPTSRKSRPNHVYTPDQAVSECRLRQSLRVAG